jgi:hypothetical protein
MVMVSIVILIVVIVLPTLVGVCTGSPRPRLLASQFRLVPAFGSESVISGARYDSMYRAVSS